MSVGQKFIRFLTRRNAVYFYSASRSALFKARCERDSVLRFIEVASGSVRPGTLRLSKSGMTIYLQGQDADHLFRKALIYAAFRQCPGSLQRAQPLMYAVAGLGELESIFWYSKVLEAHEREGYWGVCRVARSFRDLYRVI